MGGKPITGITIPLRNSQNKIPIRISVEEKRKWKINNS